VAMVAIEQSTKTFTLSRLSFNHIYHRIMLLISGDEQPYIKVQILLPKYSVNDEVININVRSNDYRYAAKCMLLNLIACTLAISSKVRHFGT